MQKKFDEDNILVEVDKKSVGYIILNRIAKHNALTNSMIRGMHEALDFLMQPEPQIKMLVIKANGQSFCAGADLKAMQQMVHFNYEENYQDAHDLATLLKKLNNYFCPTIAIVQGNAYGGGVGLICCCDFVIAASDAEFCLSEVKLGLIPAVISPYIVQCLGFKVAKRYILSAEKFNVAEALKLGMLSEVVESSENHIRLDEALNRIIKQLLNNGPMAMQKAKLLLNELYAKNPDIMNKTVEAIASIRISPEGQDGLLSFIDKRQPNWTK